MSNDQLYNQNFPSSKVWCLVSMNFLGCNLLQSFNFKADRIDLPSYGIADVQRFWKMAICECVSKPSYRNGQIIY